VDEAPLPAPPEAASESATLRALEASERMFRARFEQAAMPQGMLSLEGRVVNANDALCRMLGRDREDLQGRVLRDLLHPSDTGAADERLGALLAGEREADTWERIVARPDGAPVPLLVHAALLRDVDDTPYGIATFVQDLTALRRVEDELLRRGTLFNALVRQAGDWALLFDPNGRIRYISTAAAASLGHDVSELVDRSGWDFVHPDDLPATLAEFDRVVAHGGRSAPLLIRLVDGSGRWRWIEKSFTSFLDDPAVNGVIGNGVDVTARVEAEGVLRASEARYRAIADTAQEGIWAADRSGRTLYVNGKLAAILGLPVEIIYAHPAAELIDPDGSAQIADKLRHRGERGAEQYEIEYAHPDGARRILRFSVSPLEDAGHPIGALAMISDITQTRQLEEDLRHRALYDDLTGLPNRALLTDRIEQALRGAARHAREVVLLFVGIGQIGLVNDSWGHSVGDALIQQVAERLAAALPPGDTVARFGGHEFVVLAEGADETGASRRAELILDALREPFEVEGRRSIHVDAAIGIAASPPRSAAELLRMAHAAMYDAKSQRNAAVRVFDTARAEESADRLVLGNELRDALDGDDLDLHYQPVVELATGRVLGVEALARWTHPERGPVPPATFVAIAEATGLAPAFDRWALRRACRDLAELRRFLGPTARVAVNITASHLADGDLEGAVRTALRTYDVPADALTLEITETTVMDNPGRARVLLERLRADGIVTAIDDFGTGYSSLAYLNRLPVTTVKIDRSFVENIGEDPDALAITAAIADLAATMRLSTVAEGVETAEQLALLVRLGCTAGQGHLWCPALPLRELEAVIAGLPGGRFEVATASDTQPPRAAYEPPGIQHGLHRIMRLHRDGASLRTIAAALDAEGYRNPRGNRWHRAAVAAVISDVAYPGLWPPPPAGS
jgi:diguanylate cyclase (GGDEF)-like protein/PAS domain S-box-containing protein